MGMEQELSQKEVISITFSNLEEAQRVFNSTRRPAGTPSTFQPWSPNLLLQ
jgi:hypothetical protein